MQPELLPLRLPRLALFDLDGTLVDSVPDIAVALNRSLVELGRPEAGLDEVRAWVGTGARDLAARAISRDMRGSDDDAAVETLYSRYLAHYARRVCVETTIYPGVQECLEFLRTRGVTLAVVTNKPEGIATELLATLGLASAFAMVLGGDTLPWKKPDPRPLLHAMEQFDMAAAQTLMIGDSATDIYAARRAGIDCACVTYGYHRGEDLPSLAPRLLLDSLAELPGHFAERAS